MNFTTFTGSSRRPRNVNLSGQPSNPNPFAASSWNRPGDPSRTVHQAQVERQQRQRGRERLQAARTIQRVYRGCLARAAVRDRHRAQFDVVYESAASIPARERVERALPHLIRAFRLTDTQDVARLSRLCDDLLVTGVAPLSDIPGPRKIQFLNDMLNVLDMTTLGHPLSEKPVHLRIIISMLQAFADIVLVKETTDRLYSILGRLSSQADLGHPWAASIVEAVTAPFTALQTKPGTKLTSLAFSASSADLMIDLDPVICRNTYRAFAFEFLTSPDLLLLERDCSPFLAQLDLTVLTSVITQEAPGTPADVPSTDSLLWLLTHLIQLYNAVTGYPAETILSPLYILLSSLGKDIRSRLAVSDAADDPYDDVSEESNLPPSAPLPPYVKTQLQSLVGTESIKNVLRQFSEYVRNPLSSQLCAAY
jgi:ubiquitin-protein ligase E3 C